MTGRPTLRAGTGVSRRTHSPCPRRRDLELAAAWRRFDSLHPMVQPASVTSIVQRNKVVAKRKGAIAALTAGGAVALGVVASPVLGVLGVGGAAYLAYDWFRFRLKNGMRF